MIRHYKFKINLNSKWQCQQKELNELEIKTQYQINSLINWILGFILSSSNKQLEFKLLFLSCFFFYLSE